MAIILLDILLIDRHWLAFICRHPNSSLIKSELISLLTGWVHTIAISLVTHSLIAVICPIVERHFRPALHHRWDSCLRLHNRQPRQQCTESAENASDDRLLRRFTQLRSFYSRGRELVGTTTDYQVPNTKRTFRILTPGQREVPNLVSWHVAVDYLYVNNNTIVVYEYSRTYGRLMWRTNTCCVTSASAA